MKILILAANPRKDLSLDREIRDLKGVIEKSRDREQFEVGDELAVQVGNLQNLLLKHRPQIVHFCGHGGGREGLVFESEGGGEQWVRTEALSDLFRIYSRQVAVQCVLLNACYSEEQADAIVQHSDYVIGMRQAISDEAAIAFSKGFYLTLGYGCSIEEAYEYGCNAIQLEISGSSKKQRSASTEQRKLEVLEDLENTEIPEHLKPILKKKPGLRIDRPHPTAAERTAILLPIDRVLDEEDETLKLYRNRVRGYLADHRLETHERVFLNRFRVELGLSIEEANQILEEEQQPIEAAQKAYKALLRDLIDNDCDPTDPAIQDELKRFQTEKKLTDAEAQALLQEAEAEHQEKLRRSEAQSAVGITDKQLINPTVSPSATHPLPPPIQLRSLHFQIAAIDPNKGGEISYRPGQADYFVEELGDAVLEMVAIPDGTFLMGSPENELERGDKESPQHSVTVQPFFMGKVSVTQAQWKAIASLPKVNLDLNADPSGFKGSNRPVENVAWGDAIEFCDRLCQKTGKSYRLPSEAEWEYACRAGTTTPFHFGETIATDLANYNGTYIYGSGVKGPKRNETIAVASFPPNAFGLYDMHGNVWEWCSDRPHENYEAAPIDGRAWVEGTSSSRILRSGAWKNNPKYCRSAARSNFGAGVRCNDVGFRIVCSNPST